jgi:hypothetical protein
MIALLCFFLTLLVSPFKSKSDLWQRTWRFWPVANGVTWQKVPIHRIGSRPGSGYEAIAEGGFLPARATLQASPWSTGCALQFL